MSEPAAISGQVVDIQNDSRHKGSIKVTVHVPAELGPHLTRVLGWPTYTNPVPVGMARLNHDQPAKEKQAEITAPETGPSARAFTGYCREAIELCDNLEFQMFLSTDFSSRSWSTAKEAVCDLTGVVSRKEIVPGSPSGDRWERLKVRFDRWKSDKNLAREPN